MDEFVELVMQFSPAAPGSCRLDLVLKLPGSAAESRPLGDAGVSVALDPAALGDPQGVLRDPLADPPGYGRRLSEQVFGAQRALIAFVKAGAAAQGRNLPLRLRLSFGPGAPELQRLAWELLADPEDGAPLAVRDGVLLSRQLVRTGGRPVFLSPRRDLTALLAAASPGNLEDYGLAPLDTAQELTRVQAEMPAVKTQALPAPVTLERLVDALQAPASGYDILYLVCHGKNTPKGYALYLEDGQGKVKPTPGDGFIQALAGLTAPPRLIVTPACESAESGPDGTAFAARLAETGAAAVLGMQIPFSAATEARFLPVFFRELAKDGLVDRACAAARRAASDRPDFWAPVLLTALADGKIWKDPESGQGAKYNVTVQDSKGTVIGDNNTVTQNFD